MPRSRSVRLGLWTYDPSPNIGNGDFKGYIDELRTVGGTAIWTRGFAPLLRRSAGRHQSAHSVGATCGRPASPRFCTICTTP
jgi:hypothetical protein